MSGHNLIPRFQVSAKRKAYARLFVKWKQSESFVELYTTELVCGQPSPRFTATTALSPIAIPNSQDLAINSLLRLDAYVDKTLILSAQMTLAQLLWDKMCEFETEIHIPSTFFVQGGMHFGFMRLYTSPSKQVDEEVDEHDVELRFGVYPNVWTQISGSAIRISVASSAGYGRFRRLVLSEPIPRRTHQISYRVITIPRGELTSYKPNNPIRISIDMVKNGSSRCLGFSQCTLSELSKQMELRWNQNRGSNLFARICSSGMNETECGSDVQLAIELDKSSEACDATEMETIQRTPSFKNIVYTPLARSTSSDSTSHGQLDFDNDISNDCSISSSAGKLERQPEDYSFLVDFDEVTRYPDRIDPTPLSFTGHNNVGRKSIS